MSRWRVRQNDITNTTHLELMQRRIFLIVFATLCCAAAQAQQPAPTHPPTAAPVAPPAKKDRFHIYLLVGQSNMAGRDTRQLATQMDNPRVLALHADGQWVVARDPLHPNPSRTEPGAGPGIPFATAMLEAAAEILQKK